MGERQEEKRQKKTSYLKGKKISNSPLVSFLLCVCVCVCNSHKFSPIFPPESLVRGLDCAVTDTEAPANAFASPSSFSFGEREMSCCTRVTLARSSEIRGKVKSIKTKSMGSLFTVSPTTVSVGVHRFVFFVRTA